MQLFTRSPYCKASLGPIYLEYYIIYIILLANIHLECNDTAGIGIHWINGGDLESSFFCKVRPCSTACGKMPYLWCSGDLITGDMILMQLLLNMSSYKSKYNILVAMIQQGISKY